MVEVAAQALGVGSRRIRTIDADDEVGDDDTTIQRRIDAVRCRAGRRVGRIGDPGPAGCVSRQTRPETQYRSADPSTSPSSAIARPYDADGVGHRARAVEQPLELALRRG